MRPNYLLLSVILLAASVAQAQVLVNAEPGDYHLKIKADGTATLVKIKTVIGVTVGPVDPPPTTGLTAKVKGWTAEVNDPTNAAKLSMLYTLIANQVENGNAKDLAAIQEALKQGVQLTLGDSKAKWQGWLDKVAAAIQADARAANVATVSKVLREIAEGLLPGSSRDGVDIAKAVNDGNAEAEFADSVFAAAIDWNAFLQFLLQILPLIIRLLTGAGA